MSDQDLPDLDELPSVALPATETFQEDNGAVDPEEVVELDFVATDLGWPFCLQFNGRPWQTLFFRADSAGEAAAWATAYTRFMDSVLVASGYPPGLCSWSTGACPL